VLARTGRTGPLPTMPRVPPLRVLLVDDHEGFVTSVRALLAHGGLDVVADARNGEEALNLVAEVQPDLVLLDLRLPGMSGVEVAHLLSQGDEVPDIILISSDSEAAEDPAVTSAPVRGFLPKRDLTCAAIGTLLH
jgi:DNA-binding NarL/FixJ family response regulator